MGYYEETRQGEYNVDGLGSNTGKKRNNKKKNSSNHYNKVKVSPPKKEKRPEKRPYKRTKAGSKYFVRNLFIFMFVIILVVFLLFTIVLIMNNYSNVDSSNEEETTSEKKEDTSKYVLSDNDAISVGEDLYNKAMNAYWMTALELELDKDVAGDVFLKEFELKSYPGLKFYKLINSKGVIDIFTENAYQVLSNYFVNYYIVKDGDNYYYQVYDVNDNDRYIGHELTIKKKDNNSISYNVVSKYCNKKLENDLCLGESYTKESKFDIVKKNNVWLINHFEEPKKDA